MVDSLLTTHTLYRSTCGFLFPAGERVQVRVVVERVPINAGAAAANNGPARRQDQHAARPAAPARPAAGGRERVPRGHQDGMDDKCHYKIKEKNGAFRRCTRLANGWHLARGVCTQHKKILVEMRTEGENDEVRLYPSVA